MEELLSNGHHESLPESYILPVDKRPGLIINKAIPVIDLAAHNHEQTAMQILEAAKEYGFFQVLSWSITIFISNNYNKTIIDLHVYIYIYIS